MKLSFLEGIKKIIIDPCYPGYFPEYPLRNEFSMNKLDDIIIPQNNLRKELYIHIPFCQQKCSYCNLHSIQENSINIIDKYCNTLLNEIENFSPHLREVLYNNIDYLYFGGGTPTIIGETRIEKIIEKIRSKFNYKGLFSIETTSSQLDGNLLRSLKNIGLSRVSVGVQSFNNNELKLMNRPIIDYPRFVDKMIAMRRNGISINLDFIYGASFQKKENLIFTLESLNSIMPDTVYFYPLRLKTKISKKYTVYSNNIFEDYEFIRRRMKELGYIQSSFLEFNKIKNNDLILDNYKYVIGFGVFAVSYYEDFHVMNSTGSLNYRNEICNYINVNFANEVKKILSVRLSLQDKMKKFFILGLRNNNLDKRLFNELFKDELVNVFNDEINCLIKYLLIVDNGNSYKLSELGMKYIENIIKLLVTID